MKITPTQYAKTLYEITKGKNHQEIDGMVSGFFQLLRKNNQIKLVPKVIKSFNDIWNKEENIVEAEVITREKLSETLEHKLKNYIKDKYQAEKVLINNKVDENIKGGVIIKVGDEVLDGSISAQLADLKKQLAQ